MRALNRILVGAAVLLTLPIATLAAQPRPSADGNLAGVATLTGTCERLVLAGAEATDDCQGRIGNTMYRSGRSGFTFFVEDERGLVLTFSGADSPAEGDEAEIVLDKVIFTRLRPQETPVQLRAEGRCTYTNPYAGPSRIRCSATTEDGSYSAAFVSDGRPPEGELY